MNALLNRIQPRRLPWLPSLTRMQAIWHGSFYIILTLATLVALYESQSLWRGSLIIGLSLSLALWHHLAARGEGQRRRLVFLFGALLLWGALRALHGAYSFMAIWLVLDLIVLGPLSAALPGLVLLWLWEGLQQMRVAPPGSLDGAWFYSALSSLFFLGVLAIIVKTVINQNEERRRLIEELRTAQLERAHAERQAGILQERQRLSQEIHDTLAQDFASIVMQLEAAEGSEHSSRHLSQAKRAARDGLAEARRLVWALRPESLEGASLPQALERVLVKWSREVNIPAELTVTGTPVLLHPELEVTLLRALQEALHNVRKHAQAKSVNMTLSYMESTVALDVQDDGGGFEVAEEEPTLAGGLGLRAMRERVERLHGTLAIESERGEGTTLSVLLPRQG